MHDELNRGGAPGPDVDTTAEPLNRSVIRAMALLRELGNHPGGASAMELAEQVGLNRVTAFRLLQSLAQTGMVTKSGSSFALGWEITRLGRLADPYRDLLPFIQVIVSRLATEVDEHVAFSAVVDPITLEVIAEAHAPHKAAAMRSFMGKSFPLHAGGNGKVLLAELPEEHVVRLLPAKLEKFAPATITDRSVLLKQLREVRRNGYATIDNESEEGLFAVSVAVRDSSESLVGVLTANGLDRRMKRVGVAAFVDKLQRAAAELSQVFVSTQG